MLCHCKFFGKSNLFLICLHEISLQKKITSGLSVPNYPKIKIKNKTKKWTISKINWVRKHLGRETFVYLKFRPL